MARPFERERSGGAPVLLWVVLLLVLTAFGLLVIALVTSSTGWAWGSVAASGVSAGLLVADWSTRRRAEPDARAAADVAAAASDGPVAVIDPAIEPAEENTDVADAIAVSDLTDEVRVIDERPRYHLPDCRWVGERDTIALPVNEARGLGFTPCALCTPDSRLATVHRAAR